MVELGQGERERESGMRRHLCKDRKLLCIIIIKYSEIPFVTNLIGVLGDDGGIESEGPRAAAELLAGRGRGGGGLPVSRLCHVAVHETSGNQINLMVKSVDCYLSYLSTCAARSGGAPPSGPLGSATSRPCTA